MEYIVFLFVFKYKYGYKIFLWKSMWQKYRSKIKLVM